MVVQPKPLVIWFGILAILLLCIGASFAAYELRERDIRDAQRELRALDILLVEETERTVQSVDLVLQGIQEKLASDGIDSPELFSTNLAKQDTQEMLKARITGVPQLDAVELIGADGRLVNMSRFFPVPDVNVADLDYYRVLKERTTDSPYLSEAMRGRIVGRESLFLARRITGSSGEFIGLVVGVLDLDYFRNLFRALEGGKGGGVSLWRRDGALLVYSSTLKDPGALFKHLPSRQMRRSSAPFVYETEAKVYSPGRIAAAMSCRQFPLVLAVSRTLDEVLTDWYQFIALALAGTILGALAIVMIVWLLVRQFSTYEQLTAAVEEHGRAVAQREQAEAQLRQAQKLESIGQLTGGIAHDFNNLLTAVLGNLELLMRRLENGDERLRIFAKNAFEAASRGADLTQRLLAFSRRQPIDPRASDLAALLTSIGDLLRRTLGENIRIATVVAPDLWHVLVDRNQLENAILNIAINARDAMDGRGRLMIEASNSPNSTPERTDPAQTVALDYVRLSITDSGKGMEKEVLDRVFEPFFSTKPVGRGTGLGLSQVYSFVKQTGGSIEIHSTVGEGTTVSMLLPRAEAKELAPPPVEELEPSERRSGHILLVEDDPDVRAYTAEILRELGYVVREATNARVALAILRTDPNIGLLFTDLGLPGMDGRELVSEARRMRPELRCLYMTGYAENAIGLKQSAESEISVILKPFSRADLVRYVNKVLHAPGSTTE